MPLTRSILAVLVAMALVGCISTTPVATPTSPPVSTTAAQTAAVPTAAITPHSGPATATPVASLNTAPPSVGPTSTPSSAPTETPSATPTATSGSSDQNNGLIVNWKTVDNPGLGVVYGFDGIATAGGTMVAIGEAGENLTTAVWSSTDGRTWTAADFPDAATSSVGLAAVAAAGPGFVIVGQDFTTSAGLVYLSADGHAWTRVDSDVLAGESPTWVGGVNGAVVAFSDDHHAFTSSDGQTWQAASDPSAATVADGLMALTQDGAALWAVRINTDQSKAGQLEVWRSTDATTWSQVAALDGSAGATEAWVASGPAGVVVIANTYRHNTPGWLTWSSPDGTTWQTANNDPTNITDVVSTAAGFVAVGHYNTVGGCAIDETNDVGVTWSSVDGVQWRQMPVKGWKAREIQFLAQDGTDLVGLGVDFNVYFDNGDSGIEWVFPLPIPAEDLAPSPSPTPSPTPIQGC
jgi:hypothetical protein